MNNSNPAEDLIERLRNQFGDSLSGAAETVIERFLAPFALVPKHDFEAHLESLEQLEVSLVQLHERVAELEAQAAQASSKKRSKRKTSSKKKSDKKKPQKKSDKKSSKG